jgi:hypothetical protein
MYVSVGQALLHLLFYYPKQNDLMEKEKTSFIVRKKYRKQIETLDNEKA